MRPYQDVHKHHEAVALAAQRRLWRCVLDLCLDVTCTGPCTSLLVMAHVSLRSNHTPVRVTHCAMSSSRCMMICSCLSALIAVSVCSRCLSRCSHAWIKSFDARSSIACPICTDISQVSYFVRLSKGISGERRTDVEFSPGLAPYQTSPGTECPQGAAACVCAHNIQEFDKSAYITANALWLRGMLQVMTDDRPQGR